MLKRIAIKKEENDMTYEPTFKPLVYDRDFGYESNQESVSENETNIPPQKKIRFEIKDPRLKKKMSDTFVQIQSLWHTPEVMPPIKPLFKPEVKIERTAEVVMRSHNDVIQNKSITTCKALPDSTQTNAKTLSVPTYDNILQEIFQWNPDWFGLHFYALMFNHLFDRLQGSVKDKPPFLKFEYQMKQNNFKYEYNRKEYILRQLPFILRGLFIRLSDTFKNEAPSRIERFIFIKDYEYVGHLQLNRLIKCYALRDIRQELNPFIRPHDIITLTLTVKENDVLMRKKYFGIIDSHKMLDFNDLDEDIIKNYEHQTNSRISKDCEDFLLWDRITIITKRSQNSNLMIRQIAKMDVLLNSVFELSLINNLLDESSQCSKLLSNIFNANANIHQFSSEDLDDFCIVQKTIVLNAIEMVNKCNPMVFYKGIHNLMVIDISDHELRFKYLCDTVNGILSDMSNSKKRILVITSSKDKNFKWMDRLRFLGSKTLLKPWYVDNKKGWTRNKDIITYVFDKSDNIYKSIELKLYTKSESEIKKPKYSELVKRREIYKEIKENCIFKNKVKHYQTLSKLSSSHLIARDELYIKGYEKQLNESNLIVGTVTDILSCRQLYDDKSKLFDCCIIDDSHLMPDVNVLALIHLGVNTMIIGGDSDYKNILTDEPLLMKSKYHLSLLKRIIEKNLNP